MKPQIKHQLTTMIKVYPTPAVAEEAPAAAAVTKKAEPPEDPALLANVQTLKEMFESKHVTRITKALKDNHNDIDRAINTLLNDPEDGEIAPPAPKVTQQTGLKSYAEAAQKDEDFDDELDFGVLDKSEKPKPEPMVNEWENNSLPLTKPKQKDTDVLKISRDYILGEQSKDQRRRHKANKHAWRMH